MVTIGQSAPKFTVLKAGGTAYDDVEEFTLSEALGDGPIVLAFYPAAFTGGCTEEMCAFRDSIDLFEDLDADIYGISVDLPFAQNRWIQELDLEFPMLSDPEHELIAKYDVVREDIYGSITAARRSIFVLDQEGVVRYRWIRDGDNPDFEELVAEVHEEVRKATTA